MRIVQSLAIAAVLGVAAFAAPSASAADFGVSVNVGDGYYGNGYYESVWVQPVYRTEYYYGQPRQIIVVPGYYTRVWRPSYRSYGSYYGGNYGNYYGNNYYSNRGGSYYNRGHDHHRHDHHRRGNDRDHRGHDHNRNDRRR